MKKFLLGLLSTLGLVACVESLVDNEGVKDIANTSSAIEVSSASGESSETNKHIFVLGDSGVSKGESFSQQVVSSKQLISSSSTLQLVDTFDIKMGEFTDNRDGQVYKTMTIDSLTWMAENLNFGDYISDENSKFTLQEGDQKFCYSNVESNCETLGALYQWHTIMGFEKECSGGSCGWRIKDVHYGICPTGWHLPNDEDWEALASLMGGGDVSYHAIQSFSTQLKSMSWGGSQEGFKAKPYGYRKDSGGFDGLMTSAVFWDGQGNGMGYSYSRILNKSSENLIRNDKANNRSAYSVRCVEGYIR